MYQRAGAVFPQRSERSVPVLTPPQTQPLASYSQPSRNSDSRQEAPESSMGSDLPDLRYIDPLLSSQCALLRLMVFMQFKLYVNVSCIFTVILCFLHNFKVKMRVWTIQISFATPNQLCLNFFCFYNSLGFPSCFPTKICIWDFNSLNFDISLRKHSLKHTQY